MSNDDKMLSYMDDDAAWIVHPRTKNPVLRFVANIAGGIGGRLLDFYLTYGDRYEMNLDYVYGGDTIPSDEDFITWMKATTNEIFDNIDKDEDEAKQ